jgi:hypothetical protein
VIEFHTACVAFGRTGASHDRAHQRAGPVVTLSSPTLNCRAMPGRVSAYEPRALHPLETVLAGAASAGFTHVGLDSSTLAGLRDA